jgi:hypothetical protein
VSTELVQPVKVRVIVPKMFVAETVEKVFQKTIT